MVSSEPWIDTRSSTGLFRYAKGREDTLNAAQGIVGRNRNEDMKKQRKLRMRQVVPTKSFLHL